MAGHHDGPPPDSSPAGYASLATELGLRCPVGHALRPKDLGEREHRCEACGLAMPRDRCSSNVIRDRGYPVQASATGSDLAA